MATANADANGIPGRIGLEIPTALHQFLLGELVEVTVVVARSRMCLGDVVKLGPSSVVELDNTAARQVDISVNGRVIAWGEVVTVNGNYGVRIAKVDTVDRRAAAREILNGD